MDPHLPADLPYGAAPPVFRKTTIMLSSIVVTVATFSIFLSFMSDV